MESMTETVMAETTVPETGIEPAGGPAAARGPAAALNSRYAYSGRTDSRRARKAVAEASAADRGCAKARTSCPNSRTAETSEAGVTAETTAAGVAAEPATSAAMTTTTASARQGHVRREHAERCNRAKGDHRFTQHLSLLNDSPCL
jgi:hypothetical protein